MICVFILFGTLAADHVADAGESNILSGEFEIGKQGRLILLPVEVSGKTYSFLLDTGANRSAIDISLRQTLKKSRGKQTLKTFAGPKNVETFDWPHVAVRNQRLKTQVPIACVDFTELRSASNENIFGVIGADILKGCRFQIDFDIGVIRFLADLPDLPEELGVKLPLLVSNEGSPFIFGKMDAEISEQFLIDTGAQGNSLRAELFDELLKREFIQLGSSFTSRTIAGFVQGHRGTLHHLAMGPFEHKGLRMARLNVSTLGLRYFSRFQLTVDYPGEVVYLKKGEGFLKPEPRATSGMSLSWIGGKITVISVKKDGPAEQAGIKEGDVIAKVNQKDSSDYDHFALRQLLTSEGRTKVPIQAIRGEEELSFELILADD